VQSQGLSHNFFFGPPFNNFFFFTCGPPLFTQLLCSKKIFPPTLLLYLCMDFFFKALFLFAIIINVTIVQSLVIIADVQRKTRNCHNFMVWTMWCAIFSRRHQNKACLLQFFLYLWFFNIFDLGLGLWNLCFDYFQSSSALR
jgi:hypothetical protein